MDSEGLLAHSYILSAGGGKGVTQAMSDILHQRLPLAPRMAPHAWRLPGTVPIAPADRLQRDEVFAERMAVRPDIPADA